MTSDYDNYNDKPDWKEIDGKKDRSRHISQDNHESAPKSKKKDWVQKMYLKEIDNLFKGKKGTKEHDSALEAIHKKSGTKSFNSAVKKYMKEYGLPDDWSTLFLLMDYKDVKVVTEAILTLKKMVGEEPLSLKEGLKSKLNIMTMTSASEDLRRIAEEVLDEL